MLKNLKQLFSRAENILNDGKHENQVKIEVPPQITNPSTLPNSKGKLTFDRRLDVLRLLAEYKTTVEIIAWLQENHKISLTPSGVDYYRTAEQYQPIVKAYRERFCQDLAAVPGSTKRTRLERMEEVARQAIDKGRLDWVIKATAEQRSEMEGKEVNITLNQLNILSNEDLEKKRAIVMEKINQFKITGDQNGRRNGDIEVEAREPGENQEG